MTGRHTRVLLLLVALGALLVPQTAKPAGASLTASATAQVAASSSSQRSGVEHRQSEPVELRTATATAAAPAHSTSARDVRPAAPRLLLVQRPRPPTQRAASAALHAPTGRSPPSPAGT